MIDKLNYDSPTELKKFLDEQAMTMQKRFGQNFLINPSAREKLADSLQIKKNMQVWEIGAGLGALTDSLLKKGGLITAFEIDRGFSASLLKIFSKESTEGRFSLIEGDVLKTWKIEYQRLLDAGNTEFERVCGNLPYNIAAAILGDMIQGGLRFDRAVFTVQKEVALRMNASAGSADYSSFSVLCQWAYNISPLMDLAGGSFWPRPNVDSRAVLMTKKADFPACKNPVHFMKIQRSLFVSRRKTVKNNLAAFYSDTKKAELILKHAGIESGLRAEQLDLQALLHLSDISMEYDENTRAEAS